MLSYPPEYPFAAFADLALSYSSSQGDNPCCLWIFEFSAIVPRKKCITSSIITLGVAETFSESKRIFPEK